MGMPVEVLMPDEYHVAHRSALNRFVSTGEPTILGMPLIMPVLLKDGRVQLAEHIITAKHGEGGWTFTATIELGGNTPHTAG